MIPDLLARINRWSALALVALALLLGWLGWTFRSLVEVQHLVGALASLLLAVVVAQRDRLLTPTGETPKPPGAT